MTGAGQPAFFTRHVLARAEASLSSHDMHVHAPAKSSLCVSTECPEHDLGLATRTRVIVFVTLNLATRTEETVMANSRGPLDGVKVVACSTAQAGTVPYALMADLGAEVIKIEVPKVGDRTRASSIFPGLPSTIFETCNRGVK